MRIKLAKSDFTVPGLFVLLSAVPIFAGIVPDDYCK
jgi:hypothetical protein